MAESAPSRRTVALIVGVALVVIGVVIAAFAVFGGSGGNTNPEPSTPPTTAQPSEPDPSQPPTSDPTPQPTSSVPSDCYGTRADVGVGIDEPVETAMPTPQESFPPNEPTDPCGGTGGNTGGLFGGTG